MVGKKKRKMDVEGKKEVNQTGCGKVKQETREARRNKD